MRVCGRGSKGVGRKVNGRRACVAVVAAMGTLVAAPVAGAATLTVDDDGAQCPDAQYKSVQNAIYAARAGDTIAICPGTYVEGGGGAGSNGLIIIRDVNIKGAGADLVSIRPRRTTASGSQIAELTNASIRNAVGDLVMIDGDNTQDAPRDTGGVARNSLKKSLLTVNISGVTFDGDGVYAEAGIVFRDAQGSITRSRATHLVPTERSYDTPHPGEYKGSNDGIAIASVTAPALAGDTAPMATTPRVVAI